MSLRGVEVRIVFENGYPPVGIITLHFSCIAKSGQKLHLRKVGRKCVEMAHLRKVCMVWWKGKRGSRRFSWRWCFCAPSEGGMKMRGNGSPSEGVRGVVEGEMRQQAALVAVVLLRTFGRWDENTGKWLTFGRWAWIFGRWVEGKVYGADESVRPKVSENGQVSDIGHF